jgi:hypothetical protein
MQRIMSVGVVSLGKVSGLACLLLGFVFSIPYGLIMMLLGIVGGASAETGGQSAGMAAFGIGGGIAIMILFPLFYAVFGFVFGLIYGLILNLVLGWAGGLELEIR